MSSLRHWSSKYVTRVEGNSLWVRADRVERSRPMLIAAGHIETGKTLVTGGRTYHEFLLAA